jgi:methionine biosynthesis protein MetW
MKPTTREGAPLNTAPHSTAAPEAPRPDHVLIADMVAPGARVLDVGSGDGQLLRLLIARKNVDGRGIELGQAGVNASVAYGLSVIEGDADTDLVDYPDDSFDYVILSQTLQATRRPREVMENMLRIGRHCVVSLPNFGHWRMRAQLVTLGRMPVTPSLPQTWYDTPNIHLCTIRDFVDLCDETGARIVRAVALDSSGQPVRVNAPWWFWNLFGAQAVFLLSRR